MNIIEARTEGGANPPAEKIVRRHRRRAAAKLIFILFFLPIILVMATLVIVMAGSCLFLMQNGRPVYLRPTVPKGDPVGIHLLGPHPYFPMY